MTTPTGTQPDKIRRMAKPPMVKRTYYVPLKLYDAVVAKCESEELNVSDVIRDALEEFVKRDPAK